MKAEDKAKELVLKFGKVLAPMVVKEIIEELQEEIYEDSNIEFWYAVSDELAGIYTFE
jgi:hypothetical protein